MTQTSNRLLDEFAKLMTDMAGVAQGVRREVETAFRTQAERFLNDMDLVKREEFEAVRDMAARARDENESLKQRIAALEAKLGHAPDEQEPLKRGRVGKAARARRPPAKGRLKRRRCFPVENPIAALAPLSPRTPVSIVGAIEIRIFSVGLGASLVRPQGLADYVPAREVGVRVKLSLRLRNSTRGEEHEPGRHRISLLGQPG